MVSFNATMRPLAQSLSEKVMEYVYIKYSSEPPTKRIKVSNGKDYLAGTGHYQQFYDSLIEQEAQSEAKSIICVLNDLLIDVKNGCKRLLSEAGVDQIKPTDKISPSDSFCKALGFYWFIGIDEARQISEILRHYESVSSNSNDSNSDTSKSEASDSDESDSEYSSESCASDQDSDWDPNDSEEESESSSDRY